MTTKEAIHAMIDGKKVKRKHWEKGVYTYAEGVTFYNYDGRILNSFGDRYDWEIYEEPKPKQTVTIEKWLFEDRYGIKFIQDIEKDCVLCYCHEFQITKVKLLDTYEVEL